MSEEKTKKLYDLSHEIVAAAQMLPNEGIVDAVDRVYSILSEQNNKIREGIAELREHFAAPGSEVYEILTNLLNEEEGEG